MSVVLSVIGSFTTPEYQEAKLIAEDIIPLTLTTSSPLSLHLRPLSYTQWQSFLASLPNLRSRPPSSPVVIHSLLGYLGSTAELIQWASRTYAYADSRPAHPSTAAAFQAELRRLAQRDLSAYVEEGTARSGYQYAYLDLEVDGRHTGASVPSRHRVVLELYPAIAPLAVRNFVALCQSFPTSAPPQPPAIALPPSLHYLHSPVHRVVPQAFLQCGDLLHGHGDSSYSIYGPTFPDESFAVPHATAGVLSMVADGRHGNGSQFLLTLAERREFDGRFVGFGRVVAGEAIIDRCNRAVRVDGRGGGERVVAVGGIVLRHERPMYPITIAQCDALTPELLSDAFASWTKEPTPVPPATASPPIAAVPALALTVLVVGPLSSGKTTLINAWCGASTSAPSPTTGFELDDLTIPPPASSAHPSTRVTFYGLGGADNIRGYWPNYYDGAHAVVWVVDAAAPPPSAMLEEVVRHPMVKGKPVLVVVNGRAGVGGVCSVEGVDGGKVVRADVRADEKGVREGLEWVVEAVRGRWDELNARVVRDAEERKSQAREERERRRAALAQEKADQDRLADLLRQSAAAQPAPSDPALSAKPMEEEKSAA